MKTWLDSLGYQDYTVTPASEDASFRSYHRMKQAGQSWIVMDAPPDQEPCDEFIDIARRIRVAGLSAPELIEQDLRQGFLLLSDFGATDYLTVLNDSTEKFLYGDALAALLQMQTQIDCTDLPLYDETLLMREMDLFHDWFLQSLFNIDLNNAQLTNWTEIKRLLVANALEQPQVFVHRDYHSRNLMKIDMGNPGILDFQDAVKGPITYDLASLLRDCYIDWPPERVSQLVGDYYRLATAGGLQNFSLEEFKRWFDLMGAQRHLKAIGIFSRLNIRDGKPVYLKSIPRTLQYLVQVSEENTSMQTFGQLIDELDLQQRVKTLI